MTNYTVKSKLVAQEEDFGGYIVYVFKVLEDIEKLNTSYIMCVRYPNWDCGPLSLGDVGYLNCTEIRAGEDKWYRDGVFTSYNYSAIQFMKFVLDKSEDKTNLIVD